MTRSTAADRGSVLVDALVAIGIIAISLAFASQAVGDGALRTRAGERTRMAELEARSRMAEVGGDIPLSPGRAAGEDGPLIWSVQIMPATETLSDVHAASLLAVTVTVAEANGPDLVSLRSLRIGGG